MGKGGGYTFGASVAGVCQVRRLSEAPTAHRVALLSEADDTVVRIHDASSLALVTQHELPPIPGVAGATSHGQFVFATSDMSTIYGIVHSTASGGVWGIASLNPLRPERGAHALALRDRPLAPGDARRVDAARALRRLTSRSGTPPPRRRRGASGRRPA